MITLYPAGPRVDGSALVVYTGVPNRTVAFSVASGSGTITALSRYTDANGQAAARYTPGIAGDLIKIRVTVGA